MSIRPSILRTTLLVATLASASMVGLGAGCSSSDDNANGGTGPGNGEGGTTTGDGATTNPGSDGGVTPGKDGGGGGDDSSVTGPSKTGFVTISSTATTHTIFAAFVNGDQVTLGTPCPQRTEGSCTVSECTPSDAGPVDAGDAGPPPNPNVSAGNVTISGGKLSAPIVLQPDGQHHYAMNMSTTEGVFNGGDNVKVEAAGDTVPAFSKEVQSPNLITVTAPVFNVGSATLNKNEDLDIAWTNGGSGDVGVSMTSVGAKIVSVICKFPASGGSGTVPKAAFTNFGTSGSMSIGPSVVTTFKAGEYDITYSLTSSGGGGVFTMN